MVLAAEMMVHAAMIDGLYGTAIPTFGVERRGSPVAAFVRMDDRPIREKCQIYHPSCIVIADISLLKGDGGVFTGIQEGTTMVLNSRNGVDTSILPAKITRLAIVDATGIALEVLGIPAINTGMVGAFAKVTGWVSLSSILEGIRAVLPERLAAKNVEAARRAAEEIWVIEINGGG
jgi:2-oxoacid:acceptor oxidoreductase gamma subunit (pyruvate/2-ketoisovalerate family)